MQTTSKPKLYSPRHPERTLLYQTVAEHYETWLELASAGQFDGQGDHHTPKPLCARRLQNIWSAASLPMALPRSLRRLRAQLLRGFFPAKAGVSAPRAPHGAWWRLRRTSLTTSSPPAGAPVGALRAQTAAVPTCSATVPRSIWCCASSAGHCTNLQAHCPGAANADKASLHIGAVAFIHRFGSSLNEHVHFHVCVVDGVFEAVEGEGSADAPMQASSPSVVFHPASGIDAATVAPVQTTLQNASCAPSLHGACWRAVTPKTCRATNTAASRSTPVSASKPTTALRWSVCCAIAPVHLCHGAPAQGRQRVDLPLRQTAQRTRSDFYADRRGAKADELHLTPLELIDRIAALVPRHVPTGTATSGCWRPIRRYGMW